MAVGGVASKSISLAQVGFTTTRTMPMESDFTPSSSSAWPRMSRTSGGCDSVSIVSATAGSRRNAGSFRAFVAVHMTTAPGLRPAR